MALSAVRRFRVLTLTAATAGATGAATDLNSLFPVDGNLVAVANVSAATGTTPTLDLKLQTSLDGGSTWLDVAAFAQMTAASTLYAVIPVAGVASYIGAAPTASAGSVTGLPISNMVRVISAIGGTTPVFTGSIDLIATTAPTMG